MLENQLVPLLKEAAIGIYNYSKEKIKTHELACNPCQDNKTNKDRVELEVATCLRTASSILATAVTIAKTGIAGHAPVLESDQPSDEFVELSAKWAKEIIADFDSPRDAS